MSGVRPHELPLALLGLVRAALATRLRVRSAYWRWREDTAFGAHAVSPAERRRAMLEYGLWVSRFRRR